MQNLDHGVQIDVPAAKRAGKRIKERMTSLGYEVPLSHAYEIVASNYGFPDWATMRATIDKAPRRKARQQAASIPESATTALRALEALVRNHIEKQSAPDRNDLWRMLETLTNLIEPEPNTKIVWTSSLEEEYTALCRWIVDFQLQTHVLSKLLANDELPDTVGSFSELLNKGSFKLVDVEQALTILHGMAVEGR